MRMHSHSTFRHFVSICNKNNRNYSEPNDIIVSTFMCKLFESLQTKMKTFENRNNICNRKERALHYSNLKCFEFKFYRLDCNNCVLCLRRCSNFMNTSKSEICSIDCSILIRMLFETKL